MPMQIEHEGQTLTVYTEDEVNQKVSDEVAGLKVTNQQLKDEKKDLSDKLKSVDEEKRQAEEDKAKRDGDYQKLEELMNSRLEEERRERERMLGSIKQEKVENAISDMVHRLGAGGTKNEDLRDLIKTRFDLDYDSETGQVTVTGDGVTSLQELEKQVSESGRYDAYLAGSKASGGDAPGSQGGGAASKKPEEMTEQERVELYNADRAKFQELFGI